MARAGITYAEVEKVAADLTANGVNPTVDAVRAALGGTGSKSTIAPLLKRWKSAHQEHAQAHQAGLPAALLEAVKNLHEQMQREADLLVHDAQAAAAAVVAECRQQVADADAATADLAGKRDTLASDFAQEKSRREQLEAEHHALQLASATAQAQRAGFMQRLTDRQNEIENLNRQLIQSRSQFEHYQEAVAAQRASEREDAQQRCNRLEQDLGELRRSLTDVQKNLTQREAQLEQSGAHSARLESDLGTLRQAHQAVLTERQQLGQQLAAQSVTCVELRAQIKAVAQAMSETSAELAVLQHQTPQLQASVQAQADRAEALQRENHVLMQDKARLEGRLEQISQT
ncbi:MAG: DNA-binding protein [Oxalobacteraceae bacterium]